ncbi:MAG: hypothetical protein JNL02_06960 [Saprospiraceae bacterium]|nr:hypothetical protein [Saprospiraceae bacterium]
MKKSLFYFALLIFSAATVFTACDKKDTAKELEQDIMTSEDLAENEDFDQQLDFDADIAIEERGGSATCPVVTMDQPYGTWPNTITIDFGTGCDFNGRFFTGKIIINQSADILTPGAVRTRTFDGFSVDDIQIEGTKTWTNNGLNSDGNWSYTKTATGMKHSFPDGTSRSWDATHTSVLFEGTGTLTHWDNAWSTTGSATGINRAGQAYTATITQALIKRATCRWISQGVVEFTRDDRSASLDFGDGSCDRFGTLTTDNGNTVTIRLRQ